MEVSGTANFTSFSIASILETSYNSDETKYIQCRDHAVNLGGDISARSQKIVVEYQCFFHPSWLGIARMTWPQFNP